jgi:hypothetical protein
MEVEGHIILFWVMTPCSLVREYQRVEGTYGYYFHLQGVFSEILVPTLPNYNVSKSFLKKIYRFFVHFIVPSCNANSAAFCRRTCIVISKEKKPPNYTETNNSRITLLKQKRSYEKQTHAFGQYAGEIRYTALHTRDSGYISRGGSGQAATGRWL